MKRYILAALCVVSLNATAQNVIHPIPVGISLTKFIVDITDKDKLEDTPPIRVQASGTGDTCDKALLNAKKAALEKVNGTWVRSSEKSYNGSYNEEIVQYSGGVIKSYKYLRDDCTFVIIEADVMQRSNRVQLEKADVSKQQIVHIQGIKESFDRKQKAISSMNNRTDAVYFKPNNTQLQLHSNGKDILVLIDGTFAFTDKWRAEYLSLREDIGYFNLSAFEPYAKIQVIGYGPAKEKVFETSFVHEGDWKLWGRRTYGATPTMEVYTHRTQDAVVKFVLPDSKIRDIRSFEVKVL